MKKYLFGLSVLIILGQGCPQVQESNQRFGQPNEASEQFETGTPNLMLEEALGDPIEANDFFQMTDAELASWGVITVPVLATDDLRYIPFPETQGRFEFPHSNPDLTYCANEYLIGNLTYLDGFHLETSYGSCKPSGVVKNVNLSGQELLRWRSAYSDRSSIMDELGL